MAGHELLLGQSTLKSYHKMQIVPEDLPSAQGQALNLDRGLFEIFRTLILAKISKNDTNIIFKSLKKNNFSKI